VLEYALEILHGRLELEAHARRVVEADRAIHVAAVRDIDEDRAGLSVVLAREAVQATASVLVAGVERSLRIVPRTVSGYERFVRAALRAVLYQEHLPVPLPGLGRHKFAARVAECPVHRSSR